MPPDIWVWGPCISSEPLIPEVHSRRVTSGLVVKTHRKQNSAPIQYLGSWCRPCCTTGRTLGRWRPRDPWPPSGLWPESLQVTPGQLQEKNNTWRWVLSQTHIVCVCVCGILTGLRRNRLILCLWSDFFLWRWNAAARWQRRRQEVNGWQQSFGVKHDVEWGESHLRPKRKADAF